MLADLALPIDQITARFTGRLQIEILAHARAATTLDLAAEAEADLDIQIELGSFAAHHLREAAKLVVGYLPTTTPDDELRLIAEAILEEIA